MAVALCAPGATSPVVSLASVDVTAAASARFSARATGLGAAEQHTLVAASFGKQGVHLFHVKAGRTHRTSGSGDAHACDTHASAADSESSDLASDAAGAGGPPHEPEGLETAAAGLSTLIETFNDHAAPVTAMDFRLHSLPTPAESTTEPSFQVLLATASSDRVVVRLLDVAVILGRILGLERAAVFSCDPAAVQAPSASGRRKWGTTPTPVIALSPPAPKPAEPPAPRLPKHTSAGAATIATDSVPDADPTLSVSVVLEPAAAGGGRATAVAFDASGGVVAVGGGRQVQVVSTRRGEHVADLVGHRGAVTTLLFAGHGSAATLSGSLLVSASDDRTVRLWDLAKQQLLWDSGVLSASAPSSMCFFATEPPGHTTDAGSDDMEVRLAVSFLDGVMRTFAPRSAELRAWALSDTINVATSRSSEAVDAVATEERVTIGRAIRTPPRDEARDVDAADMPETASLVAPCQFHAHPGSGPHRDARSDFDHFFGRESSIPDAESTGQPSVLVTLCGHQLVAVAARSSKVLFSTTLVDATDGMLAVAGPATCAGQVMVVGSIVSSDLAAIYVAPDDRPGRARPKALSLHWTGPMSRDSPLWSAADARSKTASQKRRSKQRRSVDKPVTFHTSVKSSGYGATPPRKLFGADRRKTRPKRAAERLPLVRQYPVDHSTDLEWRAIGGIHPSESTKLHGGAVCKIALSRNSGLLATACVDGTACIARLQQSALARRRVGAVPCSVLTGHKAELTDVALSNQPVACRNAKSKSKGHAAVLCASSDRTATMWTIGSNEKPSLVFRGIKHHDIGGGVKRRSSTFSPEKNPSFPAEIVGCSFLWLDSFIVLASQNRLFVYDFELGDPDVRLCLATAAPAVSDTPSPMQSKDDIRRLANDSSYRLRFQFELPCKQITSICAANSFLSHLVVVACSDKSIRIVDLASSKWVECDARDAVFSSDNATVRLCQTIPDVHARAARSVRIPNASSNASLSQHAQDTLLSASTDGTVKVWDLRSCACTARMAEHVNRVHSIDAAFSPCMRFVGAGSEDSQALLYDLRKIKTLARFPCSDVVRGVAFHSLVCARAPDCDRCPCLTALCNCACTQAPCMFAGSIDGVCAVFAV